MNSRISDLALDLGVFALDNDLENGEMFETDFASPLPRAGTKDPPAIRLSTLKSDSVHAEMTIQ